MNDQSMRMVTKIRSMFYFVTGCCTTKQQRMVVEARSAHDVDAAAVHGRLVFEAGCWAVMLEMKMPLHSRYHSREGQFSSLPSPCHDSENYL